MRRAAAFAQAEFPRMIAKYVRANHVQTDASFKRSVLIGHCPEGLNLGVQDVEEGNDSLRLRATK